MISVNIMLSFWNVFFLLLKEIIKIPKEKTQFFAFEGNLSIGFHRTPESEMEFVNEIVNGFLFDNET